MKINALSILLSTTSLVSLSQADEIQIHGSGTTNPSKCIWHIMSLFNARTRDPIRMTYRAVGSSTGQAEFLGVNNTGSFAHVPHNDFGAGDIPVSTEKYNALNNAHDGSSQMVHLPFALSSVSFFYNLNGVDEIDLDGCLLAKIFSRKITKWNDPELVKINPSLSSIDKKITVCRRTKGSSSTKSITKFLNLKCSAEWGSDMVGSELNNWDESTTKVEGSAGMTDCIKDKNGGIGYLESGHGWSESLSEISLQNKEGTFTTSKQAFANGGIASAAASVKVPNADEDWGAIEFIDKAGKNTFPIVLMSYVYVRTNISLYITEAVDRGLLELFLESLYMDDYIGQCSKLAFTPMPVEIKIKALSGIQQKIKWNFPVEWNGRNKWEFETKTAPLVGAEKYRISSKRKSYQGIAIDDILTMEANELQAIKAFFSLAEEELGFKKFLREDEKRINDAMILAAISFSLWCAVIIGYIVKVFLLKN
jgi:ABC-type phosphate transport system substrate-binding protein